MITLNKSFHGFQDVEEDNEPEYIECDFGDMIINPKYNNSNELKNAETKLLKQYEEEYKNTQHDYYTDEINALKEYIADGQEPQAVRTWYILYSEVRTFDQPEP